MVGKYLTNTNWHANHHAATEEVIRLNAETPTNDEND